MEKGNMIFKAIEFAAKAHNGQFLKGSKIPYITHLINTGNLLIEAEARDEAVAAGILHDVIEDTQTDIETIKKEFGDEIAKMVMAVSELPKSKYEWKDRKTEFINKIKTLSEEEAAIICADKNDNLKRTNKELRGMDRLDLEQKKKLFKKFNAPYNEIKWFYLELIKELDKLVFKNVEFYSILGKLSHEASMIFIYYDNQLDKYGDIAEKIYASLSEDIKNDVSYNDVISILGYADTFISEIKPKNGYDEDYKSGLIYYINDKTRNDMLGDEPEENIKAIIDLYLVQ